MFAIEINEENLPKILQTRTLSLKAASGLTLFVRAKNTYYFVRGYVTKSGKPQDWGVLTHHDLIADFEYDITKLPTDWDQIVRKEQP